MQSRPNVKEMYFRRWVPVFLIFISVFLNLKHFENFTLAKNISQFFFYTICLHAIFLLVPVIKWANLYIYMCVYICVYVYIYIYICIYVYMYIYKGGASFISSSWFAFILSMFYLFKVSTITWKYCTAAWCFSVVVLL